MHITLIYPPLFFNSPSLPPGQGAAQHIGIGYLSSWLKMHGHTTTIINAFNSGLSTVRPLSYRNQNLYAIGLAPEQIIERIPLNTSLLAIGIPFSNSFPLVSEIIAAVKLHRPQISVVVGGIHASLFADSCIEAGADFVICGEGELPLLSLCNGVSPAKIPGVRGPFLKKTESSVPNKCIDNLDSIPFPDYSEDDLQQFFSRPPRGGTAHSSMSIITSRGCPFSCRFCSIHPVYGSNWRARSPENVLDEMNYWYSKHGVTHFEFEDDNLTLDPVRATAIFQGIIDWGAKITWAALNGVRVDTLSMDLLSLIKRSGCIQLNLAIESGNETVLSLMNKKLSLKKVETIVMYCGQFGIKTAGFLLVGYPGETDRSFRETVNFFKKLKKNGLTAAIPLIINAYPGTQLYDECKQKGVLALGVEDHIFCEGDRFVSIVTPHMSAKKVLSWKNRAEREINGVSRYYKRKLKHLLRFLVPV
jgi:magnesium-protoporphyrin IX monomethyl ester (oxidative) cyclase